MKVDILREGFKNKTKKLVENSTKRGGGAGMANFLQEKNKQKKQKFLHNNHFKTHLYFSIFGLGDPFQLKS